MRADLILTVVSRMVIFLLDANLSRITLAATGAHEPFSIRPIVLLRYPHSVRPSMKCFINGKISEL